MAAIDLSVCVALSGNNVAYLTYELPVRGPMAHELTYRVLANAIGYPKDKLEEFGFDGLPPEYKTSLMQMKQAIYGKIMFFDFANVDSASASSNVKGNPANPPVVQDIEAHIRDCCNRGKPPKLVVIDYFDLLRDRAVMQTRAFGNLGATTAMVQILINSFIGLAAKYSTNFFLLFQASTAVCAQGYWVEPNASDAADVKSSSRNMQLVISSSNPQITNHGKPNEKVMMRFKAVKDRLGRGVGTVVVERRGAIHKFITHEHMHFDSSSKSFFDSRNKRDSYSTVVDDVL
jgi:hypothetical protein